MINCVADRGEPTAVEWPEIIAAFAGSFTAGVHIASYANLAYLADIKVKDPEFNNAARCDGHFCFAKLEAMSMGEKRRREKYLGAFMETQKRFPQLVAPYAAPYAPTIADSITKELFAYIYNDIQDLLKNESQNNNINYFENISFGFTDDFDFDAFAAKADDQRYVIGISAGVVYTLITYLMR